MSITSEEPEQQVLFIYWVLNKMHNSSSSKSWRMQKKRYRLVGVRCLKCNTAYYPAKQICLKCKVSDHLKPIILNPLGKIISWSVLHAAPEGFEHTTPYAIALVRLDEGPTVFTQLTDCNLNELKIGLKVEAVFRKLMEPDADNIILYGLKFRPAVW